MNQNRTRAARVTPSGAAAGDDAISSARATGVPAPWRTVTVPPASGKRTASAWSRPSGV